MVVSLLGFSISISLLSQGSQGIEFSQVRRTSRMETEDLIAPVSILSFLVRVPLAKNQRLRTK